MSIFGPKSPQLPQQPTPPPPPPTSADASSLNLGQRATQEEGGFTSLISTGPQGLKRRASTQRRSLIGSV